MGIRSGVATKLNTIEPQSLHTLCYGHALNLATHTGYSKKIIQDCLDSVHEITNVMKKSPKHDFILQKTKDDISSGSPGMVDNLSARKACENNSSGSTINSI